MAERVEYWNPRKRPDRPDRLYNRAYRRKGHPKNIKRLYSDLFRGMEKMWQGGDNPSQYLKHG